MKTLTTTIVTCTMSLAALAATRTLKDGVSDWTKQDSYDEGVAPTANDIVALPADRAVTLDASDSASWALVESLERIIPEGDTSVLTVNVSSGDATLTTPFSSSQEVEADNAPVYSGTGCIVKTGSGNLNLGSSAGRYRATGGNYFDHYAALTIRSGTVTLPQEVARAGNFYYGPTAISNGATLVAMKLSDPALTVYPVTWLWKLVGEGTVTSSGTRPLGVRAWRIADMHEFAGKFSGTLPFTLTGRIRLTGTQSDATSVFTVYCNYGTLAGGWWGGYAEVLKLGKTGETSSVGASDTIRTDVHGGGLVYIGDGEECDKTFLMRDSIAFAGYNFIDAGATGGIIWSGEWGQSSYKADTTKTHRLVIMGSNENECVMSGKIADAVAHSSDDYRCYPIYIIKRGTGTWRMADNAARTGGGGYAIEEGTLRYDSIAERGTVCSLGTATNLTENYTGVDIENHREDYAYLLGSENGATMEFTGENGGTCSTRPVAVKGTGCFKVSGAGAFSFSGFSAHEAGAKLVLDTARTDGLVTIGGISDGTMPLSVSKTGAGVIRLIGGQTFTGGLSVDEGTLVVQGPNRPYRWIRWIVKEKGNFCSRYTTTGEGTSYTDLKMEEFALFDADGKRIDKGITASSETSNFYEMAPGSVAKETPDSICTVLNSKTVAAFFNGGAGSRSGVWGGIVLRAAVDKFCKMDTPANWFRMVERLPENAVPASFDLAGFYTSSDNYLRVMATAVALEGSVDGWNWEPVAEQNELAIPNAKPRWYANPSADLVSGSSDYTLKDHVGFPMRGTSTNGISALTMPISVAAGATLAADGEVTISSLRLSSVTNGTISGFSFAANGVLDVADMGRVTGEVRMPVAMSGCQSAANIAGWTLHIDGQGTRYRINGISEDGITIVPPGMIITFR